MNLNQSNRIEEATLLRKEIKQTLSKKDYLVTIWEKGDPLMGGGESERMTVPRRSFKVCSLEEISEVIKCVGVAHWRHPKLTHGMSKKKIAQIPFEEKRWGINYALHISPLSEGCLEMVHQYEESGVLDDWRESISDEDENTQTTA